MISPPLIIAAVLIRNVVNCVVTMKGTFVKELGYLVDDVKSGPPLGP